MGNKKKAKYKVGDTVVITMYGTVGKITDVKFPFLFDKNHISMSDVLKCEVGENRNGVGSNIFTFIKK